jgi:outer membrane protein insertion porin family
MRVGLRGVLRQGHATAACLRRTYAGAFLRTRGISRLFIMIATTWCLLPAHLWALSQGQQSGEGMSTQPASTQKNESSCFGHIVAKIDFPGMSGSGPNWMADFAQLHEGDTLTRAGLQTALRKLYSSGRFADLKAECELSPEGEALLTFAGQQNFFVGSVAVLGAPPRPSEAQLVNSSKLELGAQVTPEKLSTAVANIQHLLQENGYYKATITHTEDQDPRAQQVAITLMIHSGDQARVGEITVNSNAMYSRGQIEDIGHMHEGDLITAQTASNAIERIRKALQKKNHWLAQVQIASRQFDPAHNLVNYTWQIDVGPVVEITVEGFRLSKGTIRKNVPVYEEGALDEDLLNEGRRNLLSYMESRGYFDATVTLKRDSDPKQNLARVIYQIEAGERHKIVKIEITGNKYFRQQDLRAGMQVQEASVLLPRGRYSEALLRSDVRDITNQYTANGFAEVKVDPRAEDDYRGAHKQIAVMIHVTEGPQTRVGSFQIIGNVTQPAESFPPLNTQPGQPFSDANIAQDRDLLLNYYFDNGYPNASFEATAKASGDHRMDVVFHVEEGQRVFVNQVLVSGREFSKPYIVNRELQMKTGDALSQTSLLETQQKLYDTGIFSQVDTAVQNPDGTEPHKNVLVQVREAKRYTFNYGGGFEFQTGQPSTHEPLGAVTPLVSFDVTRLNFRGRNHTITFQSRVGGLQQRGLISYQAPQLFNSPNWKLTFTGFFDHTLDVQTFTSQRLEGTVQASQIINKFSSIDYRYNYRLVKALNLNPNLNPAEIPLLSLPVRLGEPGVGYIRNRRDNDLETNRGSYVTVDAGVASSYFGAQADFSRILVQYSTYHPFGKKSGSGKGLIFARSTRVGVEIPFGNTVILEPGEAVTSMPTLIPLPERFLMGGGNSHRGFGLNQAGPRDPSSGDPLGGSALFLNNLELRFPPPTLPFVGENMSFAVFEDMGNVFTTGDNMLHSLLRWHQDTRQCLQPLNSPFVAGSGAANCNYNYVSQAIGVGVRYKTPVGPVRFDFGYNLNPTIYPNFAPPTSTNPAYTFLGTKRATPFNVYFSIGQTF